MREMTLVPSYQIVHARCNGRGKYRLILCNEHDPDRNESHIHIADKLSSYQ